MSERREPITPKTINQIAYQWYLRSAAWRNRRTAAFRRAGGRCQRCGKPAEHVHHKNYLRLFAEDSTDLEALCAECHAQEHHLHPANDSQLRFRFEDDRVRHTPHQKPFLSLVP